MEMDRKRTEFKDPVYIYILETYDSRITGYKTFRNVLLDGLASDARLHITVITEDCPIANVERSRKDNIEYICFPNLSKGKFDGLETLFRNEITFNKRMVFVSNYSPSIFNFVVIRKVFPKAILLHVVHDLPWLLHVNGDVELYRKWLFDTSLQFDDKTESFLKYCTYDIVTCTEYADRVICLCKSTQELYKNLYSVDERKISVISNGLPDNYKSLSYENKLTLKDKYNIPQDKIIILLVGRLGPAKGADRISRILKKLSFNKEVCLVYVGEDDVFNWLGDLPDMFILSLGRLERDDIFEVYSVVDMGLMPSRFEQCSYVGIEMLMFGLPVITTCSYGLSDMFTTDNAIIIDDINNINPPVADLSVISRKARETYLNCYSYPLMIENWIKIIFDCIAE